VKNIALYWTLWIPYLLRIVYNVGHFISLRNQIPAPIYDILKLSEICGRLTYYWLAVERLYTATNADLPIIYGRLFLLNQILEKGHTGELLDEKINFDCNCPISLRSWVDIREAVLHQHNAKFTLRRHSYVISMISYLAISIVISFVTPGFGSYLVTNFLDCLAYITFMLNDIYWGAKINGLWYEDKEAMMKHLVLIKTLLSSDRYLLDVTDFHTQDEKLLQLVKRLQMLKQDVPNHDEAEYHRRAKTYLKDLKATFELSIEKFEKLKTEHSIKFLGLLEDSYQIMFPLGTWLIGAAASVFLSDIL